MFETLFKTEAAVERYRGAPLARSRLDYLAHLASQGARRSTLQRVARYQVEAAKCLELSAEGAIGQAALEAAADRWVALDPERRNRNGGRPRRQFLGAVAAWLHFASRLECPVTPDLADASRLAEFEMHMRSERGWSEVTVRCYRGRAREFLQLCDGANRSLADFTIEDIDRYLKMKGADGQGCSAGTIQACASALRAFFRYAEQRAWCRAGLAAAVPRPRVYRHCGLPAGPSWEDVRRLLASTEGRRRKDVRDRAVLMLIAVYGLRAAEVSALRLDSFDWEAETMRVQRPKLRRSELYPLVRSVGDAVIRYLREARPRPVEWREIFLASPAPVRPLTAGAVSSMARARLLGLGIQCERHGSHALQHACAQRLLDQGFSLQQIGASLGHRNPDSTTVYAKVDEAALRKVADFDLEVPE